MNEHPGYDVSVYHDGEQIDTFTMNCLPYPGLVLALHPGIWQVERVQLMPPQRGSIAERDKEPWLVDVIATPTRGIHP